MSMIALHLLGAGPAFSAPVDPRVELRAEVARYEAEVKRAATLTDKQKVFSKFKSYLHEGAEKLHSEDAGVQNQLRLAVIGLQLYIDEIKTDAKVPDCETQRAHIIVSFSPGDDNPQFVPWEAKQALVFADQLCTR